MGKKEADTELDLLLQIKKSLEEKRTVYEDKQEQERKKNIEREQTLKEKAAAREQERKQKEAQTAAQLKAKEKEEQRIATEQKKIEAKEKRNAFLNEIKTRVKENISYLTHFFTAIPKKIKQRKIDAQKKALQEEKATLIRAIQEEIAFLKSKGIVVTKEQKAINTIAETLSEEHHG